MRRCVVAIGPVDASTIHDALSDLGTDLFEQARPIERALLTRARRGPLTA